MLSQHEAAVVFAGRQVVNLGYLVSQHIEDTGGTQGYKRAVRIGRLGRVGSGRSEAAPKLMCRHTGSPLYAHMSTMGANTEIS
jgi:hypothetical protein